MWAAESFEGDFWNLAGRFYTALYMFLGRRRKRSKRTADLITSIQSVVPI